MSPAAARVVRVTNGVFTSNTYLCRTSTPGECLLIDPGLDAPGIEAALEREQLKPVAVFCTHGHFDHVGTAEHFRAKYGIDVHLHPLDVKVAKSSNFLMMAFKITAKVVVPNPLVPLADGFSKRFGDDELTVQHLPGHTPGSCVLTFAGHAFTGDTLYRDGVALVNLPGENKDQLIASLQKIWNTMPDDLVVTPGHGGSAPFGEVKRRNAPLRAMLGLEEIHAP